MQIWAVNCISIRFENKIKKDEFLLLWCASVYCVRMICKLLYSNTTEKKRGFVWWLTILLYCCCCWWTKILSFHAEIHQVVYAYINLLYVHICNQSNKETCKIVGICQCSVSWWDWNVNKTVECLLSLCNNAMQFRLQWQQQQKSLKIAAMPTTKERLNNIMWRKNWRSTKQTKKKYQEQQQWLRHIEEQQEKFNRKS